ncbi:MAG TPA: hypothetical protein VJK48_06825 [Chlamydiales bacterium]|nr:hypothetical protein [Chlamydiales bacterium]
MPSNVALEACLRFSDYEKTIAKQIALSKEELDIGTKQISHNEKQKTALIEESEKELTQKRSWGVLGGLANYANSLSTFAIAAHLGPTPPGITLGVSATATLVNQLVNDTIGWGAISSYWAPNFQEQQIWAERISNSLSWLGFGLGITGGYSAQAAGLWDWMNWNSAANIVQGASTLTKGTTTLANAYIDTRMANLRAKIKQQDLESEKIRIESKMEVAGLDSITKAVASIVQSLTKTIEETRVSI